jgi:hypothetical protein
LLTPITPNCAAAGGVRVLLEPAGLHCGQEMSKPV